MSVSVELVPLSVLIAASFAGGYKLFDNGKKINNIKFEKTEIPQYVIPTVFADKDTLLKTLDSLGICYSQKAGKIVTALQNSKVEFFKEKDVFNMVITGNINTKQIQKEYDNITDGYGKIVQSKSSSEQFFFY